MKAVPLSSLRSQSAMEYLITYGWAIIIVVVVLGALYQLGVFSLGSRSVQRAAPGQCFVNRPNGPNTTSQIALEGVCNGAQPQYVASLIGYTGTTSPDSYVDLGNSNTVGGISNAITITVWINDRTLTNNYGYILSNARDCCGTYRGYGLSVEGASPVFELWDNTNNNPNGHAAVGSTIKANTWYYMAATWNGFFMDFYINGTINTQLGFTGQIGTPASYNTAIGGLGLNPAYYSFNGMISNVQLYNTSLSANEISSLYSAGIGGAPIDLHHLAGWWPLNGDANDYSGNGDNGVPYHITYSGTWYSSYTPP